ncbi:hypothetical protein FHETE_7884 [Fusarium heterosporum]|uniref:Uncharacterized protein n=1 Tax=Fusarium heterosporum TaxID=42747 RepID=A0A8H5WL38_FUSHE|nr:hypothetical protein FHETE_7884 [Fusarium heterosporum]
MRSEALVKPTGAVDQVLLTPDDSQTTDTNASASPLSTAALAAAPAPQHGRSGWRVGSAMLNTQMNPYNTPGHGASALHQTSSQAVSPLTGLGLSPYHDGRIRNAVPSKLKGKTDRKQGNFGVMQMHVQKPEMTERDLAAKRTSEGTAAAAARLASAQRYVQPRRPRPQPTLIYPPSQPYTPMDVSVPVAPLVTIPSQPLPVLPVAPRPVAQPPLVLVTPQDKPLSARSRMVEVGQELNARYERHLSTSTNNAQEIGMEHTEAPSTGLDDMQDEDVEYPDELPMTAEIIEGTTAARADSTELMFTSTVDSTHPLPTNVKAEQIRLLKLLESIPPVAVVNQLCKALVHFGGTLDAPPPTGGLFPQSASNNGSGDLFISWVSEVFPSNLALPESAISQSTMQLKPLAKPRGRPKGSKNNSTPKAVQSLSTAFIPLSVRPSSDGTTEISLVPIENDALAPQESASNSQNSDAPPVSNTNTTGQTDSLLSTTMRPILPLPLDSVRPVAPLVTKLKRRKRLQPTPRRVPTGRPRGRPKGSKNKSKLRSDTQNEKTGQSNSRIIDLKDKSRSQSEAQAKGGDPQNAGSPSTSEIVEEHSNEEGTSATQEDTFDPPHNAQERRTDTVTGDAVTTSRKSRASSFNDQATVQALPGKRKELRQTPHLGTQTLGTPQIHNTIAPPLDTINHVQQPKRRRISQGTVRRLPVNSEGNFCTPSVLETGPPEVAVDKELSSTSNSFSSHTRVGSEVGDRSTLWKPRVAFQPHHHLDIPRLNRSQQDPAKQTSIRLQGHGHRQTQLHRSPELGSGQSNQSPRMPSPVADELRGQFPEALGHVSADMTAMALYQRQRQQQRPIANQPDRTTEQSVVRAIGSRSSANFQELYSQTSSLRQGQHSRPLSADSSSIIDMAGPTLMVDIIEAAPVPDMTPVHNFSAQNYLNANYSISPDEAILLSRLEATVAEPDLRGRAYPTIGKG